MTLALFNAYRKVEQVESTLASARSENISLRTRLGEQAENRDDELSICFFVPPYSSSDELMWRVKAPTDVQFRLMYDISGSSKNGRELKLAGSTEFVVAVEFTNSHVQIRTYPELDDGARSGPMRATKVQGSAWIGLLGSPKRYVVGLDGVESEKYFTLDEPFRILDLPGEKNESLSLWIERRVVTKR